MERRAINPGDWQDQFDFSQAIEVRGAERVVYCAGQVSVDANGATVHPGDMAAQFHQALDNLEIVLGKAGLRLSDIVRLNYYVTDVPAFLEAVPGVGERLKAAWLQAGVHPSGHQPAGRAGVDDRDRSDGGRIGG